jgi:hypothetical protein
MAANILCYWDDLALSFHILNKLTRRLKSVLVNSLKGYWLNILSFRRMRLSPKELDFLVVFLYPI